ncbi:hypothetical protein LTS08_002171 [Lithohypha guttulata]|nr:hypothetical protein LTS08_002171 [Lithohypha guttulata]
MTLNLCFLDLPPELLYHIFDFVYESWHLELKLRHDILIESYFDKPRICAVPSLPSVEPLLVCKDLYEIARSRKVGTFMGRVDVFEATRLKQLPGTWHSRIAPRVKRLCYSHGTSKAGQDYDLIDSLPALEVIEFHRGWGFLKVCLGCASCSIEDVSSDPVLSRPEALAMYDKSGKFIRSEELDGFWVKAARPCLPLPVERPAEPSLMELLRARKIEVISHVVFSLRSSMGTGSDCVGCQGQRLGRRIFDDLDIAFSVGQDEIEVVDMSWVDSRIR